MESPMRGHIKVRVKGRRVSITGTLDGTSFVPSHNSIAQGFLSSDPKTRDETMQKLIKFHANWNASDEEDAKPKKKKGKTKKKKDTES